MSLINEALKKAQRQRLEEGADPTDPTSGTSGGGRVVRRGKPQTSNTVVLLGSGALVLVVLSVVFTVYLVNRPTEAKRVATSASTTTAPTKTAAVPTSTPAISAPVDSAPAIVVPKITPAITSAAPVATDSSATSPTASTASVSPATPASRPTPSAPAATTSAPTATTLPATTPTTVPAVAETPAPAAALPPGTPDERVAAFVDSIRVTGIRSSGAESRVLMNERVYRVNDVVERNLGVRLVKAAADSLTFSDPRGVTYVKNF